MAKQQRRQQGFEDRMGVSAVDSPLRGDRMLIPGGQCNQGLQVVAEDLGGEVLEDCLVRQAGDVLEIQAVLESLKGDLSGKGLAR